MTDTNFGSLKPMLIDAEAVTNMDPPLCSTNPADGTLNYEICAAGPAGGSCRRLGRPSNCSPVVA
jgi:hypothetical protein